VKRITERSILAFICNWCARAALESAALHRMEYPFNVKFIKLSCVGRLEPIFIYRAFLEGFDGILVFACPQNDCHYVQGNIIARARIEKIHATLDLLGFDQERLKVVWLAANDIEKFQRSILEFGDLLDKLGSNPIFSNSKGGGEQVYD